jgi:hypothetical protein
MATPPRGDARLRTAPPTKTIPFDYVFQCALQGQRGNKVQDVIEISSEGVFVALSVGYSFVLDEQRTARTFKPVVQQTTTLPSPVFVPLVVPASGPDGEQFEAFNGFLLTGIPGTEMAVLNLSNLTSERPVHIERDGTVEVSVAVESGTGLLRVWDKTHNLLSELFEVNINIPTGLLTPVIGPNTTDKNVPAAGDTTVHVYGMPGDKVDVFLWKKSAGNVAQVGRQVGRSDGLVLDTETFTDKRTGRARRTGRAAVVLRETASGPAISLSAGDVLLVKIAGSTTIGVPFSMFVVPRPRVTSELTLAEIEAGLKRSGADLTRGFRVNPDAANLLAANLQLARLADGRLGRLFETGIVAEEEVSFLYSFDMGSTGREYQSKPIHNIAGLGIANGDRPSRPFAKPMVFEPRSSIRLQIEELSDLGRTGTLFVVLQGYKILGMGRIPG